MTLLELLAFAILAVGVLAFASLRRIEQDVKAWRAETLAAWYPVYSTEEMESQGHDCETAALEHKVATDRWTEKWGGKTLQSEAEEAECRRQSLEVNYEGQKHARQVRFLSLMVQANANGRLGRELRSEAVSRVFRDNFDGVHADLQGYFDAQKKDASDVAGQGQKDGETD